MDLDTALDSLIQSTSTDDLFARFEKLLLGYGYDRILLALMTDHPSLGLEAKHGLLKNYPTDWVDYYLAQGYDAIDPVRAAARERLSAFTWQTLKQSLQLSSTQQTMFNQAADAQLHHGAGIPLQGLAGAKAALGIAKSLPDQEAHPHELLRIHALSMQFYACFWCLHEQQANAVKNNPLSIRERDILQWLATGMTKTDVAKKVNISSHTVDFHSRQILAKLGVPNITAAVYFALSRGYIRPF